MNVEQLRKVLANLPGDMPVVIDQEDPELVGSYVEVMSVERRDDLIYRDHNEFSLDGSRPYDRPDWGYNDNTPTEPAVIIGCRAPQLPTIDGEIAPLELP